MLGKGLNSIRMRFSLLIAAELLGVVLVGAYLALYGPALGLGMVPQALILGTIALGCVGLTYLMTGNLIRPISQLKASTEAIARGEFDRPVDVDCLCEVGDLADSFKVMVNRLNANISKINTLAFEDAITQLPNRAVLEKLIGHIPPGDMTVLFIDLDKFKQVNDTLGHAGGDILLSEAARRIAGALDADVHALANLLTPVGEPRRATIESNLLFRFAGDEFVALLPASLSRDQLGRMAQTIIDVLQVPFVVGEQQIRIGATIGIARAIPGTDEQNPVKFADLAMYAAKQAGRGGFAYYSTDMSAKALDAARLEVELRAAIENGELCVHYQPKIEARSGAMVDMEALVRWNHPERGLLYPASFMSVAESCGLVEKIGGEVIKAVAGQLKLWTGEGHDWRVSVNVCPSQFRNQDFARMALNQIGMLGIAPHQIALELTETIAMADPDAAARQLDILRTAGMRIAIDDFGVGYSNLAQLYKLPFDELKLDRALIESIGIDKKGEIIIASTIDMAHALGHRIVAEGVETKGQYDFLVAHGCDRIQGYLFARPMDASALKTWVGERKAA